MIKNSTDWPIECRKQLKKSLKDIHTKVLDDITIRTSFEVNDIVWDMVWNAIITQLKNLNN